MSRPSKSQAERLRAAQLLIDNSMNNPEIQTLVAQRGYDAERLQQGKDLLDRAVEAANEQELKIAAQQDATEKLKAAETKARAAYQDVAKSVRPLKDKALLTALGLTGAEPQATAAFLKAAYTLFDNAAQTEILAALSEFGYTTQKLKDGRDAVVAFDDADRAQETAKAMAQDATQKQEVILKKLDEWVGKYKSYAKLALADHKQFLEALGIAARTSPTAAQRRAKAKKKTAS